MNSMELEYAYQMRIYQTPLIPHLNRILSKQPFCFECFSNDLVGLRKEHGIISVYSVLINGIFLCVIDMIEYFVQFD